MSRYADLRTIGGLSNDNGSRQPDSVNLQQLLDSAAGELESSLTGRYAIPILTPSGTVPTVLTQWVAVHAYAAAYRRRADMPRGLAEEVNRLDEWLQKVMDRKAGIPGVERANAPQLLSSEFKDGRSRFDPGARYFDRGPSSTGTSKGQ